MDDRYISILEFCTCHQIEYSFINSLTEHGLLQTIVIEEDEYVEREQVRELERMLRLHFDLEINIQGIDAINHLLTRVSRLQNEVRLLENRLRRFEDQ